MNVKLIVSGTLLVVAQSLLSQTTVKILFDATKAESAGNADWVIDADTHNLGWFPNASTGSGTESNAQKIPTAAQSGITASTPETYWNGALSNWAIDCVKRGYKVETLPANGQITYGSTTNAQDLSHYKVFVVDEPNILFTTNEKIALMHFIQNGGGLFMVSDHDMSDRNNDGEDSPTIWNDFISNNTIANNSLGFTFDLANISQTSTNIPNLPNDSIINGPMGHVSQVMWANGTTMTLNPVQNPSVKGVVYVLGNGFGNSNVMCAYSRIGLGKVAALGDSSPTDDGTGDSNDQLYNGYTQDANGNHQTLIMNMTIWLADTTIASPVSIEHTRQPEAQVFPNPSKGYFSIQFEAPAANRYIELVDALGSLVYKAACSEQQHQLDCSGLSPGIYYVRIMKDAHLVIGKTLVVE